MGKHEKDKRKYRTHWESAEWAKGWLQHSDTAKHKNPNDLNEAYCKVCEKTLRSHVADLQKHARSKKHQENAAVLKKSKYKSLVQHGYQVPIPTERKVADIKLALYIAMHSSVRSVDHLCELLSTLGKGSQLEKLRLHRTKCSNIIKHVIAPVLLTNIVKAIGDNAFSIIIDESTDVSVTKYLCMCIKYFDTAENRMLTDFLGILEVEKATADNLYKSIVEYFQQIGIPLKNMTALGTDGASNLCGCNHSVYTLLKSDVPNLQLMKCTCHSVHLCSPKASEELPSSLAFLAKEVYNWFSVSASRRINYKKTFDMINSGFDGQKYRQMIQLSKTRCLAFYDVVKRLLEQWIELKTHFRIACDAERRFSARMIRDMLEDDSNRLYLVFLKPILAEVQHLNISFQSDKVDVGSLYVDMSLVFLTLAGRTLRPVFMRVVPGKSLVQQVVEAVGNPLAFLPVAETDFGTDFATDIDESQISAETKSQIKHRCFLFWKRLLMEMAHRLPSNFETFKKTKLLNPSSCISQSQVRSRFEELPLQDFLETRCDISLYKSQWEKMAFVDWNAHFNGNIPSNIVLFWPEVYKYTDACGRFVFRDLAEAVLKLLTMPTSNAAVERAFSALTLVKTRVRNKLRTSVLQALLRIRMHFQSREKCYKTFQPPTEMIELFKARFMYGPTASTSKENDDSENNDADSLDELVDIIADLL